MKRIIASILTLLLLLSLCACGGNKKNNKTETNNQTSATESKKQEESTAGETVSEPEKTFDTENTEKLYLRFTTTPMKKQMNLNMRLIKSLMIHTFCMFQTVC